MKQLTRTRIATVAAALSAACLAQASPVISPYADNLSPSAYTADATWPGTSAEQAFNGGVWNAGGFGNHWIQADMGSSQWLSEVRFTVGVSPTGVTTTQWVFLSDTPIGPNWNSLAAVATRQGVAQATYTDYVLTFAPAQGRYLQIVSNGGNSWTQIGGPGPVTPWVDNATAPMPAVPEPETYALMLGGLAVMGWARRRTTAAASPDQETP